MTIKALTKPKMQKWTKNHFLGHSFKIIPALWKTMFRVSLPGFAWFFVHFHKLIRPHPGPLWGRGLAESKIFLSEKTEIFLETGVPKRGGGGGGAQWARMGTN